MVAGLLYLLFFLSGAAALAYQVVWVRSLTLVFGTAHLAVIAVLSVLMGGLAIGGQVIGRRADRSEKPLRLYGLLELGIAISALLFIGLMQVYPSIYALAARGRDDAPVYTTAIRLLFAFAALIIPTVLMGGTLPVVSRIVASRPADLRRHLAFLYGVNTLGAAAGALLTGFVWLRWYTVGTALGLAVATSLVVSALGIRLQKVLDRSGGPAAVPADPAAQPDLAPAEVPEGPLPVTPVRWVLWGIGLSGFCALGYEVLWTRVLATIVGGSVYGLTIMLAAFLTGIALGSHGWGVLARLSGTGRPQARRAIAGFGIAQVLIGLTALLATVYLRDVPVNAVRLQEYFSGTLPAAFQDRMLAISVLAFAHMFVPALFMGAAFPLAGEVLARYRAATGRGVGNALAANAAGAALGAAVTGLVLLRVLGIETSLQLLTVVNLGVGLVVLASLREKRWPAAAAGAVAVGVACLLVLRPGTTRTWDQNAFAVFRSNQPEAFRTAAMAREAVQNTDVLYYAEGTESIVSVIKVKGGEQAFIANGTDEASSHMRARQVQLALGHLPMLLHDDPRDVLVIGLGSGMTAGATAVHPGVASVTVVEIEPRVLDVARTFEAYNHRVLDDPKVRTVLNDGRNFLLTTNRQFDVITADPPHPRFQGAGSLYASEYFALIARRLRPGGVVAERLPIYEMSAADLASVVKTFQQHFSHTMLWLAHDAVLVGRNDPFGIDEHAIDRRIDALSVAADLRELTMGSAADLLGYFVMGTAGMQALASGGVPNTDDRPYLEASAPFSDARPEVMAANAETITSHRESLLPDMKAASDPAERDAQENRWAAQVTAGRMGDRALVLSLGKGVADPDTMLALRRLTLEYPAYGPGRALWNEYEDTLAVEPRLLQETSLHLMGDDGGAVFVQIAAVLVPVSRTRAAVMFVDNRTRTVYGEAYMDDYDRDERASRFAADVMDAVSAVYQKLSAASQAQNGSLPAATAVMQSVTAIISSKVKSVQ